MQTNDKITIMAHWNLSQTIRVQIIIGLLIKFLRDNKMDCKKNSCSKRITNDEALVWIRIKIYNLLRKLDNSLKWYESLENNYSSVSKCQCLIIILVMFSLNFYHTSFRSHSISEMNVWPKLVLQCEGPENEVTLPIDIIRTWPIITILILWRKMIILFSLI